MLSIVTQQLVHAGWTEDSKGRESVPKGLHITDCETSHDASTVPQRERIQLSMSHYSSTALKN